ncbi:tRNA (adenosine(37)-N6)-threonylcarbamoyltransferase complex transferase subunit TsaD [Candidatus Uhrbacteria bacterium]|nr:tRNA (adenosine(37)-N6)-threonylcarbamoyltransferase complex transferase subunit TsaD [Candidatus Uhrbacteria bacterium]
MRILGIETSCDESAVALLEVRDGRTVGLEHLVATQAIHARYGGVVPEVAAREHSVTVPLLLESLAERAVGRPDGRALGQAVDVVAVASGPGLVTSLKIGLDHGRVLAAAWDRPLFAVNHIEGHIHSNWLPGAEMDGAWDADGDIFPALVLVVSGGHTEMLLMAGHGQYRLLGATRDDAAGEAFDKTAKMMGLGYPGGPALARLAEVGNPKAFDFPRPLLADPSRDFSFSGLKTAVRYFLRDNASRSGERVFLADVAASVQAAIVDVLVGKAVRAAVESGVRSVMLAGGVAANAELRQRLRERLGKEAPGIRTIEPPVGYCTDNAAMVAAAAYFQAKSRPADDWRMVQADPHWEIGR